MTLGLSGQGGYHDDSALVGDEPTVLTAFSSLQERVQIVGLQVSLGKHTPWSPQGMLRSPGPVASSDWRTPHVVLGTPFGSAAAKEQFLRTAHEKHTRLLQRLTQFPDPRIAALRYCLGAQKVNHLLRVLWYEHSKFVTDTAASIRRAL